MLQNILNNRKFSHKTRQPGATSGLVLFALSAAYVSVGAQPPGIGGKPGAMPAMPVITSEVVRQELRDETWFSGSIISRRRADLAAEYAGRIVALAEVGDRFDEAEIIVRFDDTLLRQTLDEQQAEIAGHLARIEFLKKEVARLKSLVEQQNAAQNQYEETMAELDVVRSQYRAGRARIAQTTEKLRRMTIVAPFAGIVNHRYADIGEWLSAGEPAVELVNPDDLEITTSVTNKALTHLKPGDLLRVKTEDRSYQAQLRAIVPVGDSESRLFELRLDPLAAPGRVHQLVRVAVPISSLRKGLVIPEDALIIRQSGISVFTVDKDNKARRVTVTPGLSNRDGLIEVSGALQNGDRIVVRGGERLRDGMEVRKLPVTDADRTSTPPAQ